MLHTSAATQDELRRHNLARLVRILHNSGATTRSDLVASTGLNRSTVGVLVTELVTAGLVEEVAGPGGNVGRPSLVVRPVADSAVVTAFDVRVGVTVGAIVGLGGTTLATVESPNGPGPLTPEAAVAQIVSMAAELFNAVPDGASWVGVGVAIPGVVNIDSGLVLLAPNLQWSDVEFGAQLETAMRQEFGGCPLVHLGNDANLGAMSESVRGVARGRHNVIYLSGDVGIGGGIVLDGRILSGNGGYGGEVGHMVVRPDGRRCRCGSQGCWETEIGQEAILRAAGLDPKTSSIDEFVKRADEGDPQVLLAMDSIGDWIGIGLSNLVNTFNPDAVILGGHLGRLLPYTAAHIADRLAHSLPGVQETALVTEPGLGARSTLVGASEVAFGRLLADPLGEVESSHALVAS
jgi:predicted NBD/HSP70 family sugar kinase